MYLPLCSYFYATVGFGTPMRHFDLIVDTGSTITYVPCSNCGSNCGKHKVGEERENMCACLHVCVCVCVCLHEQAGKRARV
jgi:hypothetical protein